MSRNSSEPRRLAHYARIVGTQMPEVTHGVSDGRAAITAHNTASPGFAVDTAALASAERALAGFARLAQTTMVTAAAFIAADRSGGPVRRARTDTLATLGSTIIGMRFDHEGTPDSDGIIGFVRQRSGTATHGPLTVDGHGRIMIGAEGSLSLDGPAWKDGGFVAGAGAEGFAGILADGSGSIELGPAAATGALRTSLGLGGNGEANAALGRDGLTVATGGDLFAGARIDGEVSGRVANVEAGAACHAAAGVGASVHAEAEVTWDEIGVSAGWGVTWLLGGGCTTSFSVSPSATYEMVRSGGEWVVEKTGNLVGGAYDFAADTTGTVVENGRRVWDSTIGRVLP